MGNNTVNFETLREANLRRLPLFTDANGKVCHTEPDGSDWSLQDWGLAVCGEAGELANVLKKVRRGDYTQDEATQAIADEAADVLIYLDLLASRVGFSLADAVKHKFNLVSHKKGIQVTI